MDVPNTVDEALASSAHIGSPHSVDVYRPGHEDEPMRVTGVCALGVDETNVLWLQGGDGWPIAVFNPDDWNYTKTVA